MQSCGTSPLPVEMWDTHWVRIGVERTHRVCQKTPPTRQEEIEGNASRERAGAETLR